MATSTDEESIRVCVRVRPLAARERDAAAADGAEAVEWRISDTSIVEDTGVSRRAFAFDRVFRPAADNASVYAHTCAHIVGRALRGFNGTVFAYGQTGSGKTYSMLGTPSDPGILPRAVSDVFDAIERASAHTHTHTHTGTPSRPSPGALDTPTAGGAEFLVRVSYLEVYNEEINDLLQPLAKGKGRNLKILREDALKGAVIEGLLEEIVVSREQVMDIVARGEANRHYGSTALNAGSSRSHTIFRLVLESKVAGERGPGAAADAEESSWQSISGRGPGEESGVVRVSYLNLVDLAGSERQDAAATSGDRLREGGYINKSLSALAMVISKLAEVNKRDKERGERMDSVGEEVAPFDESDPALTNTAEDGGSSTNDGDAAPTSRPRLVRAGSMRVSLTQDAASSADMQSPRQRPGSPSSLGAAALAAARSPFGERSRSGSAQSFNSDSIPPPASPRGSFTAGSAGGSSAARGALRRMATSASLVQALRRKPNASGIVPPSPSSLTPSASGAAATGAAASTPTEHIPYRNSKLTRLLRQSLGGNACTAILCTMSPAAVNKEESISTLKFGQQCKTIRNRATVNEMMDEKTLLKQYRARISELKAQIAEYSSAQQHAKQALKDALMSAAGKPLDSLTLQELQQQLEVLGLPSELVRVVSAAASNAGAAPAPSSSRGAWATPAVKGLNLSEFGLSSPPPTSAGALSPRSAQLSAALAEIDASRQRASQLERTVTRLQSLIIGGSPTGARPASSADALADRTPGDAAARVTGVDDAGGRSGLPPRRPARLRRASVCVTNDAGIASLSAVYNATPHTGLLSPQGGFPSDSADSYSALTAAAAAATGADNVAALALPGEHVPFAVSVARRYARAESASGSVDMDDVPTRMQRSASMGLEAEADVSPSRYGRRAGSTVSQTEDVDAMNLILGAIRDARSRPRPSFASDESWDGGSSPGPRGALKRSVSMESGATVGLLDDDAAVFASVASALSGNGELRDVLQSVARASRARTARYTEQINAAWAERDAAVADAAHLRKQLLDIELKVAALQDQLAASHAAQAAQQDAFRALEKSARDLDLQLQQALASAATNKAQAAKIGALETKLREMEGAAKDARRKHDFEAAVSRDRAAAAVQDATTALQQRYEAELTAVRQRATEAEAKLGLLTDELNDTRAARDDARQRLGDIKAKWDEISLLAAASSPSLRATGRLAQASASGDADMTPDALVRRMLAREAAAIDRESVAAQKEQHAERVLEHAEALLSSNERRQAALTQMDIRLHEMDRGLGERVEAQDAREVAFARRLAEVDAAVKMQSMFRQYMAVKLSHRLQEVSQRETAVAEKEETLRQHALQLNHRSSVMDTSAVELEQRVEAVEQREREVLDREATSARIRSELETQVANVEHREAAVHAREQAVHTLEVQTAQRGLRLDEEAAALRERDAACHAREAAVSTREAEVGARERDVLDGTLIPKRMQALHNMQLSAARQRDALVTALGALQKVDSASAVHADARTSLVNVLEGAADAVRGLDLATHPELAALGAAISSALEVARMSASSEVQQHLRQSIEDVGAAAAALDADAVVRDMLGAAPASLSQLREHLGQQLADVQREQEQLRQREAELHTTAQDVQEQQRQVEQQRQEILSEEGRARLLAGFKDDLRAESERALNAEWAHMNEVLEASQAELQQRQAELEARIVAETATLDEQRATLDAMQQEHGRQVQDLHERTEAVAQREERLELALQKLADERESVAEREIAAQRTLDEHAERVLQFEHSMLERETAAQQQENALQEKAEQVALQRVQVEAAQASLSASRETASAREAELDARDEVLTVRQAQLVLRERQLDDDEARAAMRRQNADAELAQRHAEFEIELQRRATEAERELERSREAQRDAVRQRDAALEEIARARVDLHDARMRVDEDRQLLAKEKASLQLLAMGMQHVAKLQNSQPTPQQAPKGGATLRAADGTHLETVRLQLETQSREIVQQQRQLEAAAKIVAAADAAIQERERALKMREAELAHRVPVVHAEAQTDAPPLPSSAPAAPQSAAAAQPAATDPRAQREHEDLRATVDALAVRLRAAQSDLQASEQALASEVQSAAHLRAEADTLRHALATLTSQASTFAITLEGLRRSGQWHPPPDVLPLLRASQQPAPLDAAGAPAADANTSLLNVSAVRFDSTAGIPAGAALSSAAKERAGLVGGGMAPRLDRSKAISTPLTALRPSVAHTPTASLSMQALQPAFGESMQGWPASLRNE